MTMSNTVMVAVPSGSPVTLPSNGAETLVMATAPVSINQPGAQGVGVSGVVHVLWGAGTTSATIKVYRGTIAGGVVVESWVVTVTASTQQNYMIEALDALTSSPAAFYTVSVTSTGTSATAAAYGALESFPCSAAA